MKTFREYSDAVWSFASYPARGDNLIYPALGLSGESGEVAEKIKKLWRNEGQTGASGLSEQKKQELVKELGDVLWYVNAMCRELGVELEQVAAVNAAKLSDRAARNVIKSEGDER
ncbi:MAG: nucleoside triphosphate pyrophosphohydrolase family protein [Acidobacteriaceae bacterium]